MPKIKEFKIRWQYLANYGGADRTNDEHYKVPISNYETIEQKLKDALAEPEKLHEILQAEFVYPEVVCTRKEVPFNSFPDSRYIQVPVYNYGSYRPLYSSNSFGSYYGHPGLYSYTLVENPRYGQGQRDTNTYEQHKVAPVLEELVVNHNDTYRALIQQAELSSKKELLNFSTLDLSGADISNLDYSLVNFTRANLKNTSGITQELLDQSESYVDATLPKGIIPFWTNDKKTKVLAGLNQLAEYGEILLKSNFEDARKKGQLVIELAEKLTTKIKSTSKYNGAFQTDFLATLHQHDAPFNAHRFYGLKMIIVNITLCILGLGVGYVAAGLIHKNKTGRFMFFSQTTTEQDIAAIDHTIIPDKLGCVDNCPSSPTYRDLFAVSSRWSD